MPSIGNTNDQATTARDLGYGDDVDAMNFDHDVLHGALCHFLSVPSWSLALARGEPMTTWQRELAAIEEEAVLACQRLRQMARTSQRHGT